MDVLKKIFPYSFGVKDVKDLVIKVLVYLVGGAIVGFVLGLIPLLGGLLGTVVNLYTTVGWILAILDHFKVLK